MPATPPEYPWYQVGTFEGLQQGDLLPSVRVPHFTEAHYDQVMGEEGKIESVGFLELNVIVLSQSCDLENDKIDQVVLCRYLPATTETNRNRRQQIASEKIVGLHMLEQCDEEIQFGQLIIDFRTTYGMPKAFLLKHARSLSPRARLLPPYREHLAQAFARFFMRVGLPRNMTAD